MKRLLTKASMPFGFSSTPQTDRSSPPILLSNPTTPHTTGLQPKFVVPAVPQPYPHTHLAILVTKEGLLIRPHFLETRIDQTEWLPCIRVSWGKSVKVEAIEERSQLSEKLDWNEGVIVYGIVGILELFSCSYLLLITSRIKIGNVLDPLNVVYAVTGVVDIPLVEDRARIALKALAARNKSRLKRAKKKEPSPNPKNDIELSKKGSPRVQFSSDLGNLEVGRVILRPSSAQSTSSELSTSSDNSVATATPVFNTLAERLSFWNKRLPPASDKQHFLAAEPSTLTEEQEAFDRLTKGGNEHPAEVMESILASTAPPPDTTEERHSELETKVVRECVKEFTKGGMYFAYRFDITRSLQHKQELSVKSQKQHDLLAGLGALPSSSEYNLSAVPPDAKDGRSSSPPVTESYPALPLWRRIDKRFWWNEWMSKPFIDAGLHSFILPIMQGYCQISQFHIPPDPSVSDEDTMVDYMIISRRSKHRPGLRYQRRGIDDAAQVANFVETETIMRIEREGKANIFAYIQIRGSIPLFWTQTDGLKPPPVLSPDRTHEQNLETLKRHFEQTIPCYGPHTIVNLAEQHGKEGAITQSYREYIHELDMKDVQYHEYDFHTETKGMKYEKISNLIEKLERTFESQGYFWMSDNVLLSQQKGVFRVNCIDCLDRTNVVQSAFARCVLHNQLCAVALHLSNAGRTDVDMIFNDAWANNGDAISRAYAGTSALKGDFTRTGKRDLNGLLNDGVNSLARMYTSTFSDWFCQAVIDFMLGNRTASVFSEFLLKLKSTDPRDLIRLSRIRAEAIATSVSRVLPERERLLSGWTLFGPEELNRRVAMKFEEKVLLLSAKAVYVVSYDYSLQKVKLYTRVPLGDIVGISKGAYILSPLEESSRDPEQNAGFVLTWSTSNQESRVTSYSVRNSLDPGSSTPPAPTSASFGNRRRTSRSAMPGSSNVLALSSTGTQNFAAFKVLPIDPTRTRKEMSAVSDQYVELSDEMQRASSCREAVDLIVNRIQDACEDMGGGGHGKFVTEEDVVSIEDARRSTSVYAKMEYGVKRLLWLGS